MEAQWPNLFIPGAPRAGTTSLWRYLSEHPEIYMSPVKEPAFFAPVPGGRVINGKASYLRLFDDASCEKWRGEASTAYFSDESSPSRIKATCPESKIIIVLRDPVERAYSHYWFHVRHNQETRSFREAVEEELTTSEGADTHYTDWSFYATRLERYLGIFGNNVHVLFLEELRANVDRELRTIYEFLDVDWHVAEHGSVGAHNAFVMPRNGPGTRVVQSPALLAFGRKLPRRVRRKVVGLVMLKSKKPNMDREARSLLRNVYKPERKQLELLLGRPLPW